MGFPQQNGTDSEQSSFCFSLLKEHQKSQILQTLNPQKLKRDKIFTSILMQQLDIFFLLASIYMILDFSGASDIQ
jgi:hypothetical protein